MWDMVVKTTVSSTLAMMALALLAALPAKGEDGTFTTKSGDIGLTRSDDHSELALQARQLFETGMAKDDARKLAAAAEIMSRLPDTLDLRTIETAPPTEMNARDATTGQRRTSGLVPILMTPGQVLDAALDIARRDKDESLVAELEAAKNTLPQVEKRGAGQSCVWANCCGRWGCWRWCQWW